MWSTESGNHFAPIVIAATGPWTRPLFRQVGVELPIESEYHQVAILRNAPIMKGGGCACIDSVTATYFRSDAHDKFLVGDFYGKRPVDPDNFPQRASDESLEEIIERACRRIPKLENAEVMRGVTGVYDMTPDCRPLLGEIPGNGWPLRMCRIFRHGLQDFSRDWPGDVGTDSRRKRQSGGYPRVSAQPLRRQSSRSKQSSNTWMTNNFQGASMKKKGILERLKEGPVLGDGGYLLELEKRGWVRAGPFTPEVALLYPDALRELHIEFREAGAEVLQALTFYASRDKLATVGLENRLEEMNRSAVRIAREVAGDQCLVAGNLSLTWMYEPDSPSAADRSARPSTSNLRCR